MERTPEEIRKRADQAERIMGADGFTDFVADAQERITDDWRRGKTTEDRERAFHRLQGLTELVAEMAMAISDQQMEDEAAKKLKRTPLAQPTEK